mmetsp:Transcript_17545/g.40776  ORF Transcript_17545/g.40776 Transcript_17545/m.40776 type:complete len:106 (+) Transcript_17545:1001-1318(+)
MRCRAVTSSSHDNHNKTACSDGQQRAATATPSDPLHRAPHHCGISANLLPSHKNMTPPNNKTERDYVPKQTIDQQSIYFLFDLSAVDLAQGKASQIFVDQNLSQT